MADIRLRIVTPTRCLYDEMVEMVIFRAAEGDMGVMHGHIPLTTSLSYGAMRIMKGEEELHATVFGGFVEITPEQITVLSDSAEWPDEIDKDRALRAKERAEERLKAKSDSIDVLRAELALRRALVRMDVANTNSKR